MNKKLLSLVTLLAAGVLLLGASQFAYAQMSGGVFTTEAICNGTNINIFSNKDSVYLDGGPDHPGSAGLPDGSYYVKVTEPNGTLLGTSVGSSNNTPAHVTNGSFDHCYQLSAILIKASDSSAGYDTTSNNGGEYKVWVSSVSSFDNDHTKTDNFKVNTSATPTITPTPTTNPCIDREGCVTPTATPTPTMTVTPTPTTTNGGGNDGGDGLGCASHDCSTHSSTPSQAVLGASTMAATGTFEENTMNLFAVAGIILMSLSAVYAKAKANR